MIPLFSGQRRIEDLFTEAVGWLFERQPALCLAWLKEVGIVAASKDRDGVHVTTQKTFVTGEHGNVIRPDLWIEVRRVSEDPVEGETVVDAVMIESKIGSVEGKEQLRKYADHLAGMAGFSGKTLLYITRAHDPKTEEEVVSKPGTVDFKYLRWNHFYRFLGSSEMFLGTAEKDVLVEEIMTFMEELGMSRSQRFSPADLMALSRVPQSIAILYETLDEEVNSELKSFVGNKVKPVYDGLSDGYYYVYAPLAEKHITCAAGYNLNQDTPDGYPAAYDELDVQSKEALGRDVMIAAMKEIARREDWQSYDLDGSEQWAGVWREISLAVLLPEADHVEAAKRFFIDSIHQLKEELTAFKKEHPDLPWNGGESF